jgi:predicted DNA-binding protein (MmcQ/YjbR family)
MDNERIRAICLSLPFSKETVNWGHHLVYWAGDRDLGGKMFAMTDLDGTGTGVLWFHCGAERFHEMLEIDGIFPSPYLAKAFWVTLRHWDVLRPREIEEELRRAHALIYERLPKRVKDALAAPPKQSKPPASTRKTTVGGSAARPADPKRRARAPKATRKPPSARRK